MGILLILVESAVCVCMGWNLAASLIQWTINPKVPILVKAVDCLAFVGITGWIAYAITMDILRGYRH